MGGQPSRGGAPPHQLSRADARRVAVRAQWLDAGSRARGEAGAVGVTDVVGHLGVVQHDPTRAVAPSADLVLWTRLGDTYRSADLRGAIDEQRLLVHDQMVRVPGDLALLRAGMAQWPGPPPWKPWQHELVAWVEANDGARTEVLAALRGDGPLPAAELPDSCEVPWRSSGWNDGRNLRMLLKQLVSRGEVAVADRDGGAPRFDLAERVYPDDPVPDPDDAARELDRRRLQALGIARARAAVTPGEPNDVGEAGEAAVVDGVKGTWRVAPELLDADPGSGTGGPRAALLSPLDRLVADRKRLAELFDYEYLLEMYKPAAQRRWGYWAMPILLTGSGTDGTDGDRFVGKLDATADRAEGVLRVDAVHLDDGPVSRAEGDAVDAEIEALAGWLGLELYRA